MIIFFGILFLLIVVAAMTFDFLNPYVDEIVEKEKFNYTWYDGSENCHVNVRYKRTYKNGKVIFFTKREQ